MSTRFTSFEEAVSGIESEEKDIAVLTVPMSSVSLNDPTTVTLDNSSFSLGKDTALSLVGTSGVPVTVSKYLWSVEPSMWLDLCNKRLQSVEGSYEFRIDRSRNHVRSFSPLGTYGLSCRDFLRSFKDSQVDHLSRENWTVSEVIYDKDAIDMFVEFDRDINVNVNGLDDIYRFGAHIRSDAAKRYQIHAFPHVRRLWCSNGATTPIQGDRQFKKSFILNHSEIPQNQLREYVRALTRKMCEEVFTFQIEARLKESKETFASLAEAFSVYETLRKLKRENEDSPAVSRLPEKVNMHYAVQRYGLQTPEDLKKKTSDFSHNARSPFTQHYLQNVVTWEARHNPDLSAKDSIFLKIHAGNILYNDYDLREKPRPSAVFDHEFSELDQDLFNLRN